MKELVFMADTRFVIRGWDSDVRDRVGYQLFRLQNGLQATDSKPLKTVGPGVQEIRINLHGQWRVIYVAKLADVVHVLAAFQKKNQKTPRHVIELARRRLRDIG